MFSNLDKDVDFVIEEEKKTHIKVSSTQEIIEKITKWHNDQMKPYLVFDFKNCSVEKPKSAEIEQLTTDFIDKFLGGWETDATLGFSNKGIYLFNAWNDEHKE